MKNNLTEWKKYYDKIKHLGKLLQDSRTTITTDKRTLPYPIATLDEDTQIKIESEIALLTSKCRYYLDANGFKCPNPLWYYDRKNPKTWLSADRFDYGHLL